MSAYQSNGKVKPPTNVASSTTSIKIAEKAPPAPCSRMGAMQNEGTPTTSAVHAFGNEHSGASLNAKAQPWGDATASRSWSRAQRLARRIYRNEDNQAAAKIIEV